MRHRRRWDRLRVLVLVLALLALFLPRLIHAQSVHFNIKTPKSKVSPIYTRISEYIPDHKVYERWWKEISDCQGLPLPPEHLRLKWVHVNAVFFIDADRDKPDSTGTIEWSLGKSYLALGIVMIALPNKYDEEVIKHEMTHWLILWAGERNRTDHPPLHFDGHCGVYPKYHGGPYRVKA